MSIAPCSCPPGRCSRPYTTMCRHGVHGATASAIMAEIAPPPKKKEPQAMTWDTMITDAQVEAAAKEIAQDCDRNAPLDDVELVLCFDPRLPDIHRRAKSECSCYQAARAALVAAAKVRAGR